MGQRTWKGRIFFEAHLEGADLQGADFSNANMQGVSYNGFSLWTWLYHVLLRLIGRTPPPVSRYQGIYVETCRGNQRFQRFAKDQAYLEELRYSRKVVGTGVVLDLACAVGLRQVASCLVVLVLGHRGAVRVVLCPCRWGRAALPPLPMWR